MDVGFNMFALANNDAFDYGATGIEETLYHFAVANAERAIAYAGIGSNFEEAIHPSCLDLDGTRIAFSAIGLITGDQPQYRAGPKSAGQASFRNRPDFEAVVDKLIAMPADYRILSIHYGLEGRVVPDDRQLADWRGFAAEEKGIDLIVGHHPHVAQGVELDGKSLIFYGLGNFLHPGTARKPMAQGCTARKAPPRSAGNLPRSARAGSRRPNRTSRSPIRSLTPARTSPFMAGPPPPNAARRRAASHRPRPSRSKGSDLSSRATRRRWPWSRRQRSWQPPPRSRRR